MISVLRKILCRPKPAAHVPVRNDWEDWPQVMWQCPPYGLDLIIMRREWDSPRLVGPIETWHPEMNVAGLHWRTWHGETIDDAKRFYLV